MPAVLPAAPCVPPSDKPYLSKAAVAKFLGTSLYLVGGLIDQGSLETIQIGRRRYVTTRSARRLKITLISE